MTTERTNRRDEILEAATRLFIDHGYAATSVRQIAEAVGCTEAALYYHFKHGKRALLQAAVESNVPDLLSVLDTCQDAASMRDLVARFGTGMAELGQRKSERLRWLMAEFRRLNPGERALLHQKYLAFFERLVTLVARFVPDPKQARYAAILMLLVPFGYSKLFLEVEIIEVIDLDPRTLIDTFAGVMAAAYAPGSRDEDIGP
jgi:AcrR family transcriptional regulator